MANLTASRNLSLSPLAGGSILTGDATNATTFYRGGFVFLSTATGYIVKAADTANYIWRGVVGREMTGSTSTTPNDVEIITGPMVLNNYSVTGASAVTNQGTLVYATDDQTLTTSATSNTKAVGEIIKWLNGTKCDVLLYAPEASRALN